MDEQLMRELIAGQKAQTELLRKYLWRFRFSLLSLLLLTTATAIGLGILVYENRSKSIPATSTLFTRVGPWSFPSQGTLIVTPPIPNQVITGGTFENSPAV